MSVQKLRSAWIKLTLRQLFLDVALLLTELEDIVDRQGSGELVGLEVAAIGSNELKKDVVVVQEPAHPAKILGWINHA